jgi:bacterioferritin-associated ferredoxin
MILADAFQIRNIETGEFLQCRIVIPPSRDWSRAAVWGYDWHADPQTAGAWTEGHIDRFLLEPGCLPRAFDGLKLEKVRAPACGCCGGLPREMVDDRWQLALRRFKRRGEIFWRCEKHVGRNPCCIEGCGKTFALQPDKDGRGAEDYSWRIMCGKCWRQAPKWMRDRVAKIRKLARRRGWSERIHRLHHMAWEACYRAIVDGRRLDMTEINKMFGWG